MLVSNIEFVPGQKISQHLGMVQGNTVRAKHAGRDIMASIKNLFGGELVGYTELLQEAREEATERMIEQAESIGANAVIPSYSIILTFSGATVTFAGSGRSTGFANAVSAIIGIVRTRNNDAIIIEFLVFLFRAL